MHIVQGTGIRSRRAVVRHLRSTADVYRERQLLRVNSTYARESEGEGVTMVE